MKRILILAILALLALPVLAQQITPNSPCGAEATGMRPDDRVIVTHKASNLYVDPAGFWALCPSVHGGQPEPKRDCLPEGGRVWEVNGNRCSTTQSGQGSGVPGSKDRSSIVLLADNGSTRGALALRCEDGRYKEIGATCEPAVTCAPRVKFTFGSNAACTATLRASTTPTQGTTFALPIDPSDTHTGSVVLVCNGGEWSFAESPVCVPK